MWSLVERGLPTGPSDLVYTFGGTILADARATRFWSQNHDLVLPLDGTYGVQVDPTGSGYLRFGLGSDVGRADPAFGDPYDPHLVLRPGYMAYQPFVDMEVAGTDILVLGGEKLSRFDDTGQHVSTFGVAGEVDLTTLFERQAYTLAVQPDGRIVVAALGGTIPYPWAVARFLPDGSLDSSFGTDGIVVEDGGFEPITAVIQPDGRILLGSDSQLRRYTASGARDASFGAGGIADMPSSGVARVVALEGGDIVGVGELGDDGVVVRMNADGSPAAFGDGGQVVLDFGLPERLRHVVEDDQGRLIVVGLEIDLGREVLVDAQGRIVVGGQTRGADGFHISRSLVN